MDQLGEEYESTHDFSHERNSSGRRHRRAHLAMATAAMLASASTCSAFTPTSGPLACYASRQSPLYLKSKMEKRPKPFHHDGRGMVSFLEPPSSTTDQFSSQRKRKSIITSTRARRKTKERTQIEINLQPSYEISRERSVPLIDSEILYKNISRAPLPLRSNRKASERVGQTKNYDTLDPDNEPSTLTPKPNKVRTIQSKAVVKKKSTPVKKSSTMPGFIRGPGLDDHIVNLSLKRISSPRKLSRVVRSKSAKMKRRQSNSENMYRKSAAVPNSLIRYAQEIHTIERVTPKEEKELGFKTQEAMKLQLMHSNLQAKYGRDPTDDEWCAATGKLNVVALKEAIQVGMEAKNQLVASNLRMVQRVVNIYIRNGLGSQYNANYLMQDGTIALIRAAEKYEPERGFRFSTYAMYWIRSAVKRSQTSQSRIMNIPLRVHERHKHVTKIEARLRKEFGRPPTKDELAEACDISILQLDRCRKAMQQVTFSLDAEVKNSLKPNSALRGHTMYDIIGKDETEHEKAQQLLMKDHLISTLRKYLSAHEVDLLLLRFGLMDKRALPEGFSGPLTIAEVSKLVGLKPDKVRRIIMNSLKQLRYLMKDWEGFEYDLA